MTSLDALRHFVSQHPDHAEGLIALGAALNGVGEFKEAAAVLDRALAVSPEVCDGLIERGLAAAGLGDQALAQSIWSHGAALYPDVPAFPLNLGQLAEGSGDQTAAEAFYRQAVAAGPELAAPLVALAGLARGAGDPLAADKLLDQAITNDPNMAAAWTLRARVLKDLNRGVEAVAAGRRAVALAPDAPAAKLNLAYALLMTGAVAEGFSLYTARFAADPVNCPDRSGGLPPWDGHALAGKHLYVWREQGVGDEILFITKLPDLVKQSGAAHISWAADPRLVPLFSRSFPDVEFIAGDVVPKADCQVAAGSLALLLDGPPKITAHLQADPGRAATLRRQLESLGPAPYLGLCWRGLRQGTGRDPHYTTPADWLPLAQKWPGTLVNLQYGAEPDELQVLNGAGAPFVTVPYLDLKDDLDGVAALITALDIVISVDSAIAPLSSIMGTPTGWAVTAGRWPMLGQSQNPWFQSAFTAEKPFDGEWAPVVLDIADAIRRHGARSA